MTSDNCRKEEETKACIDERGQYLLPFTISAMDVAGIKEDLSHENKILPLGNEWLEKWGYSPMLKTLEGAS